MGVYAQNMQMAIALVFFCFDFCLGPACIAITLCCSHRHNYFLPPQQAVGMTVQSIFLRCLC
jgi:hypothetical protein